MVDRSDKMIKMARSTDDSGYLNSLSPDDIENEVGFDNQNSVAIFSESWITGHSTEIRILLKQHYAIIEFLNESQRTTGAILGDVVEN
jgi:hypothetical protein